MHPRGIQIVGCDLALRTHFTEFRQFGIGPIHLRQDVHDFVVEGILQQQPHFWLAKVRGKRLEALFQHVHNFCDICFGCDRAVVVLNLELVCSIVKL